MTTRYHWIILATTLAAMWASLIANEASATEAPAPLQQRINAAQKGAVLELSPGVHAGPIKIDKSITLQGESGAIIDGGGQGDVIAITAPDVTVQGLTIRNTGDSLDQENTGVAITAPRATIKNNRIENALFGVYLKKAEGAVIRDNVILGKDLDIARRGDAIRLWYSSDCLIENNVVRAGRDVVLWFSDRLTIRENRVSRCRYGLHFMYSDDNVIERNMMVNNSVGAFLMYSRNLTLRGNLFARNRGPSGYGVGLKDMDGVIAIDNRFVSNRVGIYLDNSPWSVDVYDHFESNIIAYNHIGVAFLPAVKRNIFTNNGFIENFEQIAILGQSGLDGNAFAQDGRGNYWSDYQGFDRDGDGIGDVPHKPTSLFEDLMARHPKVRVFMFSPAVQAIETASQAFPIVEPRVKITDPAPLMSPPSAAGATPPAPLRTPMWVISAGLLSVAAVTLTGVAGALAPKRSRDASARPHNETTQNNTPAQPVIEVANLIKRFGRRRAVDDLSFTVAPGQAVALWGPNGAGKTTVIRCLIGLLRHRGEVRVAGKSLRRDGKTVRREIGYVPQELAFYDDLRARSLLAYFARLKRASQRRVDESLNTVGLSEHARKRVGALSGGMKRRLSLAIALLADPPLLILDEPTANLDAQARDELLAVLARLRRDGKTVLFTSHRYDDVSRLADRVIALDQGRLRADCTPEKLARESRLQRGLRLTIDNGDMNKAIEALREAGFDAQRIGETVRVAAREGDKAAPIRALESRGLSVVDFDLDQFASPDGGGQ